MLLRTAFVVRATGATFKEVSLPLEVRPEENVRIALVETENGLRIVVHQPVDASRLEVVLEGSGWNRELPDGTCEPLPRLRLIGGMPSTRAVVDEFVHALSFLTDLPIWLSPSRSEDAFIPETAEEKALLGGFGTDQPFRQGGLKIGSRTFNPVVDADSVAALRGREPGLRLYSDAIKIPTYVGQFRELWRVLESAFGRRDDDLVECLAAYPPARQIGFDRRELQALLVLRGRASHAQSKAGTQELIYVDTECHRVLARLKNLIERVVLTKQTWGYPTAGVRELTSLEAYTTEQGGLVVIKRATQRQE